MFIGSCEWGVFSVFWLGFLSDSGPSGQSPGYVRCNMLIICVTSLVGTTKVV